MDQRGTAMIQDRVWLISVILMAAIPVVFLWVAASAGQKAEAEAVQRRAYRVRAGWFWLLVAVIAIATVTTLRALPYPDRGPQAASRVIVRATGAQWAWTIEGPDLVVGKPVEFQVTSTVAQTQAMPGYVNRLHYTFTTPGNYRICA